MAPDAQHPLFESAPPAAAETRRLQAQGLRLTYDGAWLPGAEAEGLLRTLEAQTPWRQDRITLFGRSHDVPRLTAWYGDPGCSYAYSGLRLVPLPWTEALGSMRARVARAAGVAFNSVLLNWYRDGNDSMGWHADDEPELGPDPVIASVSLGAARTFQLKHRQDKTERRIDLDLEHGSLLVMHPPTQAHWVHAVPKRRRAGRGGRINLTFRYVEPTPRKGAKP